MDIAMSSRAVSAAPPICLTMESYHATFSVSLDRDRHARVLDVIEINLPDTKRVPVAAVHLLVLFLRLSKTIGTVWCVLI